MEKHQINENVELLFSQLHCKTPVAISDMHRKCMHVSSNYIHTQSYKTEILPHADHKLERLNLSVKGRQHRQKGRSTQSGQNVIYRCISATPKAGIETQIGNGLEIQPPDYWVRDHLKPDLTL